MNFSLTIMSYLGRFGFDSAGLALADAGTITFDRPWRKRSYRQQFQNSLKSLPD